MTSLDRFALGAGSRSQRASVVLRALAFALGNRLRTGGLLNYVYIFHEIFERGDYDAVLPGHGKRSRVFDIGGNVGLYTLYLNERFGDLETHVFEPVGALYDLLRHNVRACTRADAGNTVFFNNVGLGEMSGQSVINYFPRASGLSTLNADLRDKIEAIIHAQVAGARLPKVREVLLRWLAASYLRPRKEYVRLIRLGDYMDCHRIERIDIVKIDVEGYELRVLQGLEPRHFARIEAFMIEVENYASDNRQRIVDLLQQNGFVVTGSGAHEDWSFLVARRRNAT